MPLTAYSQGYYPQESAFTFGQDTIGLEMAAMVAYGNPISAAWPATNRALFYPLTIQVPAIAQRVWVWNGSAVSGNFDIGIFDENGNELVGTGTTAQSGTNTVQNVDITDTLLGPGTYWLGVVFDNTTATTIRVNPSAIHIAPLGCYQQASAYPLPNPATFVRIATDYVPMAGVLFRSAL